MRRRGYTLAEILTYLFCFAVLGALVASIYRFLLRTERVNESAFEVTGMAHTAIQSMRSELEETALATVRADKLTQSLSFCSARDPKNALTTSEYGTPRWQKSVLYAVKHHQLLRWERQAPGRDPFVLKLPVVWPEAQAKVCLRDLTADGFRVQFVQRPNGERADQLVDYNPVFNQTMPERNTRLVEVEFRVADGAPQRQNFYAIRWRVTPRY